MTETQDDNQQQTESTPPAGAQSTEHMIPKSRFDDVNNKYKDLQAQFDQLQAAQLEKEKTELAEQNKFQELYEQAKQELDSLKSVKETATRYQEALHATNQSRIEQVPEDKRSLVPEYDDPVKLGAWLDDNLSLIIDPGKPAPPKLDGGSGATGDSSSEKGLSAEMQSIADIARQHGYKVDSERVAKHARNPVKPTKIGEKD